MVAGLEVMQDGTQPFGSPIQGPMQRIHPQAVSERLRLGEVLNPEEDIVDQTVADPFLLQLSSQQIVPIEVELQTKRRPRGHPQIAESQVLIDEVEVVVEALRFRPPQGRLPCGFVVPRLEGGTRLHRGKDVDQAWMSPPLPQQLLNPILLAEILAPDELDSQACLSRQPLCMLSDLLSQRLCPLGVVEEADFSRAQEAAHGLGVANLWQCPGDYHPVKAGKSPLYLVRISFPQDHPSVIA